MTLDPLSPESSEPEGERSERDSGPAGQYLVVARRYRPQSFDQLIGQQQVAKALSNAIHTQRVGHAYLFTGARGVGKTSAARIFAKALNCASGPSDQPCNQCDLCISVSTGEDVDVLEIDGASNRGIDEIRQLRSNVNVRPSRARYKIYIIDEVHMLTSAAFNALLKTLEEPPEHVKFVFCTTDPEKIPITVLSRCQRFDFAPVKTESISQRLNEIARQEGVDAEPDALHILARRAAGSMRDSQSLLEQLLSFCSDRITVDDVHSMLGTAGDGRIRVLVERMVERSAAEAIGELDQAVNDGVDAGQLAEQLLGAFRDLVAASVGCPADLMLHWSAQDYPWLVETGKRLGVETALAMLQILDQAVVKMRQSIHVRILLEMAIVRICKLQDLDALGSLIQQVQQSASSGSTVPTRPVPQAEQRPDRTPQVTTETAEGKKNEKTPSRETPAETTPPPAASISQANVERVWQQTLAELGDTTADFAGQYDCLAIRAPNQLVVTLKTTYNKEMCDRAERKQRIEEALARITGQRIRVDFEASAQRQAAPKAPQSGVNRRQRLRQTERDPMVRRAIELFDAEITDVDFPRNR